MQYNKDGITFIKKGQGLEKTITIWVNAETKALYELLKEDFEVAVAETLRQTIVAKLKEVHEVCMRERASQGDTKSA